MVLIISQESDHSTSAVMDWLYYKGQSCVRINSEDFLRHNFLSVCELNSFDENLLLNNQGKKNTTLNDITSVWYRRDGHMNIFASIDDTLFDFKGEDFFQNISRSLFEEYTEGKNATYACLEQTKKILGNYRKAYINKIETLFMARKCGLDIPKTIITNSKSKVKEFLNMNIEVITKPIHKGGSFTNISKGKSYATYTEEINEQILDGFPETFFYSLFQEKLRKEIEIRSFFIDGKCYSMAIFSQLDTQTNVDFRKYNQQLNNRNVPFKLPERIENEIVKLMDKLDLNTGSIDIVKTTDGRYVFLEVNPVGQYGMTSIPCNYHLDKKIAEYLTCYEER